MVSFWNVRTNPSHNKKVQDAAMSVSIKATVTYPEANSKDDGILLH